MPLDQLELLQKSPLGILICDSNQRVTWCNERFLTDTQLNEDQIINQLYPALPIEAVDKKAQLVQLFSENTSVDIRFQYWQEKLEQLDNFKIHYFIKERQQPNKLDLATGMRLPKRASWVEFLDYEISRSRRYNNPLSVLKLHLVFYHKPEEISEDKLHQIVKDTLSDQLRWADMVGHTDQGSYLLVLPETPENALKSLQEKINVAIKNQVKLISEEIDYQVIFAHACWQKHDDSQKLLQRARYDLVKQLEAILS